MTPRLLVAGCALLLAGCGSTGAPPAGADGATPAVSAASPDVSGAADDPALTTPFGDDDPVPVEVEDFVPTAELRVAADGSGDFTSLVDAVRAAPTGARLVVAGGSYRGSLVLDKPVILEAERARPSIHGTSGPTVVVRTDRAILRDLIVHGPEDGPVVTVERGAVDAERCVLVGRAGDGLLLARPGTTARLVRSAVTSAPGAGARISGGAHLDAYETEFARNGVGVHVDGGSLRARDGRFAYNGTGLLVSGPGGCDVDGGFLWSNTEAGVHLTGGAPARLTDVTVRAPGGLPGVLITGGARGTFTRCTVSGTPMEADHHAGGMTREHIATPIRDGTDHHILTGLVLVEDRSSPTFRSCLIENALGHGLLVNAAAPLLEDCEVTGSVFYNVFLTDGAEPVFRGTTVRDAGENGVFAWLGAGGLFEDCRLLANGSYTEDRNRWAQVVLADAASTRFVDCVLRGGGGAGVVVSGFDTTGELLRCELSGHGGVGLSVSAGGAPRVHHVRVRDNGGDGLWITRGGAGRFQDVRVESNGGWGVHVDQDGEATLVRCLVQDNADGGVLVRRGATPRLDDCTIRRNTGHGVQVDFDGRVVLDDCTVADNDGIGVLVEAPGRAVLVTTDVHGNRQEQTLARAGAELEVQG